jgi:chromosome segregation ATPase
MDDNKVAILLEDLLSKFRTFGEGQDALRNEVHEIKQKVDGLIEDMDIVKPSLAKINNRLDNIEGEIIKLNPESRAALKQVK